MNIEEINRLLHQIKHNINNPEFNRRVTIATEEFLDKVILDIRIERDNKINENPNGKIFDNPRRG